MLTQEPTESNQFVDGNLSVLIQSFDIHLKELQVKCASSQPPAQTGKRKTGWMFWFSVTLFYNKGNNACKIF